MKVEHNHDFLHKAVEIYDTIRAVKHVRCDLCENVPATSALYRKPIANPLKTGGNRGFSAWSGCQEHAGAHSGINLAQHALPAAGLATGVYMCTLPLLDPAWNLIFPHFP